DILQSYLFARGGAQRDLLHRVGIRAIAIRKTQRDRVAARSIDHFGNYVAGTSAGNRLFDVADVQAIAGQRGAIYADGKLGHAGCNLHLLIGGAAYRRNFTQHLLADRVEYTKIFTKYFYREVGFHA